ncbi:MAG: DUF1499 domain-containing protein [Planctomycetota bacterium]
MNENAHDVGTTGRLLAICLLLLLSACGNNHVTTGIVDGRLTPCPESPNCVSSDAPDELHRTEPYRLKAAPEKAWHGLREVVEAQERVTVVTANDTYLHVEVRSAIFRFVDDAEFHLRTGDGIIAVRSAARVGHGDMGVNRKRIETIREALRARNLIE